MYDLLLDPYIRRLILIPYNYWRCLVLSFRALRFGCLSFYRSRLIDCRRFRLFLAGLSCSVVRRPLCGAQRGRFSSPVALAARSSCQTEFFRGDSDILPKRNIISAKRYGGQTKEKRNEASKRMKLYRSK